MKFKTLTVFGYSDGVEIGELEAKDEEEANEQGNNTGNLIIIFNKERWKNLKTTILANDFTEKEAPIAIQDYSLTKDEVLVKELLDNYERVNDLDVFNTRFEEETVKEMLEEAIKRTRKGK